MTAERSGEEIVDPRIKPLPEMVAERGWNHIEQALVDLRLLEKHPDGKAVSVLDPLTEGGLVDFLRDFTTGITWCLSKVKFKNCPERYNLDLEILARSMELTFKEIHISKIAEGLMFAFPNGRCPIERIPLLFDPKTFTNEKPTILLRPQTIRGCFFPKSPSGLSM